MTAKVCKSLKKGTCFCILWKTKVKIPLDFLLHMTQSKIPYYVEGEKTDGLCTG